MPPITKASGLLISWAIPAASVPTAASRSACLRCAWSTSRSALPRNAMTPKARLSASSLRSFSSSASNASGSAA